VVTYDVISTPLRRHSTRRRRVDAAAFAPNDALRKPTCHPLPPTHPLRLLRLPRCLCRCWKQRTFRVASFFNIAIA